MLSFFALAPIVVAVVLYIIPSDKIGRFLAITVRAVLLVGSFYLFMLGKQGEIITVAGNYSAVMGITLQADALSSVLLMLTSFIFFIVTIFSFNNRYGRLFGLFLFTWQGLLNGIFLTRDLFTIFILNEVATVVVAVMIMFHRDRHSIYDGMLYLMVNTVAGLFYLFGVGYVYKLTGVLDIAAVMAAVSLVDKDKLLLPTALIMTAISLKCALIPLFSWLPKAHGTPGAPTVVSAVLSGLHIKSALYLFIRLTGIFQDVIPPGFFVLIGIITGIVGFLFALAQTDIKLILAYHTISQMGLIMIGLNLGDDYSYIGSVYHIINHSLFKSALFLCAGIITRVYGTRDIYRIRGVLKRLPPVGWATVTAILGITGTPLFNGSISKYFIVSGAGPAVTGAIIFINLGTIVSFIKYATILFGTSEAEGEKTDVFKQAAVVILGVLCFTGGVFGEQVIYFLFGANVSVDAAKYLEKVLLYAGSLGSSFFIFKHVVQNNKLLARIKKIEFDFKGVCMLTVMFFVVLLITSYLFVIFGAVS